MGVEDHYANYASLPKPRKGDDEEASLVRAFSRLQRPLMVVFIYWILQFERSDLTGAFLRSRVACPPPEFDAKKGACPRGSFLSNSTCSPHPSGSRDWSGSSQCANKFLVVTRATAIGGQMSSCSTICNLVAQIFVGSMLVDSWGRKPVMIMALIGSTLCSTLFFASCFTSPLQGRQLMFGGVAAFSLTNAFPAASLAVASDLSRSSMVQRGISYTAIFIVQHVGILTAFGIGFSILALDLTDYREVWGIFVCVSFSVVFISCFVLRETLGPNADCEDAENHNFAQASLPSRSSRKGGSCVYLACSETVTAFRLVWDDTFLRYSMLLTFLANVAATGAINITGGYLITVVGLTQAVASLGGIFQPLAIVGGSSCSTFLLTAFGPYMTYFMGIGLTFSGLVIAGLSAVFRASAEGIFWTGWIVVGMGWGMAVPSHAAFNSARVPDKNDHGKLFAAMSFVAAMGATIGSLIWTNCIFKTSFVESWLGGLGYFISAGVFMLVLAGYLLLYLVMIRGKQFPQAQESLEESLEDAAAVPS